MIMEKALNSISAEYADYQGSDRLEILRLRINDENYLRAAIQRLALVMSNELMLITKEGGQYERKRRK